jgi:uncharacterized metal-binding protein YceD (DUF177 family)
MFLQVGCQDVGYCADYFCFGITLYEETANVVLKCQVSNEVLNPCTSYIECYRHWVEVTGLSFGSGVTW